MAGQNQDKNRTGKSTSNRPRFRDVKKELDSMPKARLSEDKLLVGCLAIIILAGLIFLLAVFLAK